MVIRLYNSLSRTVEDFVPADPNRVTMYVCGPTVYDKPHIGNARPAVVFDVLYRLLIHAYGLVDAQGNEIVQYVRNYTDVDDKIIARAAELDVSILNLTYQTIGSYIDATNALGNILPWRTPKATDYIGAMISMIEKLVAKGNAYVEGGDVLFDINSYAGHGILSAHKQEDLENGQHRIRCVASYKRNPGDFTLWKPSDLDEPGWDSPWGRGRPGWHIECSAMIREVLGETIDIHGGGADLRFPHHECEISQSCCANDTDLLARYWLHNAMVLVNGEKMAKSKGNFVTVEDALQKHRPEAVRLFLLGAHYRSPLDMTDAALAQASQTLSQWHRALEGVVAWPVANKHSAPILEALGSDLNTPLAIAKIFEAMTSLGEDTEAAAAGIRYAAKVMGIDLMDNDTFLRGPHDEKRAHIEKTIADRSAARERRDWPESDRLREVLNQYGVIIEDNNNTSAWRLV